MAGLQHIYSAQRGRDQRTIVQLSASLQDELLMAPALLALSGFSLRLKPAGLVVCSDASVTAEASVAAPLSGNAVKELQKQALQKGLWNKLLQPIPAYLRERGVLSEEKELPEDHYAMRPVWEELVSSGKFQQFTKPLFTKSRAHINIKEVRAALAAEAKIAWEHANSYYIHLQDSQVSWPVW